MKLLIAPSPEAASRQIADIFLSQVKAKPDSLLALATGGTVVTMYQLLCQAYANGEADFSKVRTVNLDEYLGLSKDHPQSFAFFMREHFFKKTNVKNQNVFLVDGAGDPQTEVDKFKAFLHENTIDLMLLGIGNNGHIGFNEPEEVFSCSPHMVTLAKESIVANARFFDAIEDVPREAITIGVRDIVRSERVVLAAFGAKKADAIAKLFADDNVDPMLPCSIIKLSKEAYVVVDRELAEAAGLKRGDL